MDGAKSSKDKGKYRRESHRETRDKWIVNFVTWKLDTCWKMEIQRQSSPSSPFPENIGTTLVFVLSFALQSQII
jgi:hypothetical protein